MPFSGFILPFPPFPLFLFPLYLNPPRLPFSCNNQSDANPPNRFTTKGIVALVFSCISGILGVAVVAWYGFAGGVEAVEGTQGTDVVVAGVVAGKDGSDGAGKKAVGEGSGGESDGVVGGDGRNGQGG